MLRPEWPCGILDRMFFRYLQTWVEMQVKDNNWRYRFKCRWKITLLIFIFSLIIMLIVLFVLWQKWGWDFYRYIVQAIGMFQQLMMFSITLASSTWTCIFAYIWFKEACFHHSQAGCAILSVLRSLFKASWQIWLALKIWQE